jgi:hypothetical protein
VIGLAVLAAVVLAALAVGIGSWLLDRTEQRRAFRARVLDNLNRPRSASHAAHRDTYAYTKPDGIQRTNNVRVTVSHGHELGNVYGFNRSGRAA